MKKMPHHPSLPRRQRGVIMVVALITLVVLMIGAVAMIRSMNAASTAAGSYGFKRDMANQGTRALVKVQTLLKTGVLASDAARGSSNVGLNYSAVMLPTTPEGIPNALVGDEQAFGFVGSTANDINTDQFGNDIGIKVRYVIDRLCSSVGPPSDSTCMVGSTPVSKSGSSSQSTPPSAEYFIVPQAVYRLTIKVTGPRNAQAFYQSTFTT